MNEYYKQEEEGESEEESEERRVLLCYAVAACERVGRGAVRHSD